VLGVRPHAIGVGAASDEGLHGEVLLWEWLGEEGQADVDCDGTILQVVTERDLQLTHGDPVSLRFAPEHMLVFDADSHQRLDIDFSGA
jgi:ABC-type sugar transport system ATPase subunit